MTTANLHPPITANPRGASRFGIAVIVLAVATVAVIGATGDRAVPRIGIPICPRPSWTPPAWVFGPVWTVLYTMMAVAAAIVCWWWRIGGGYPRPTRAFGVQLSLNMAWSILFFGLKSPLLGFLDICLLWVATGVTVTQFFLVSRPAGWLYDAVLGMVELAAVPQRGDRASGWLSRAVSILPPSSSRHRARIACRLLSGRPASSQRA